jgi:hypothetical protein
MLSLSDGRVINCIPAENNARFLNHACAISCEAVETDDRVSVHARAAIAPGEVLFIDYSLTATVRSPTIFAPTTRAIAAHRHVVEPCRRSPGGSTLWSESKSAVHIGPSPDNVGPEWAPPSSLLNHRS